jgi:hypothetical protein
MLLLLRQQHFQQFPAEIRVKIIILRTLACDSSNVRTARRKTLPGKSTPYPIQQTLKLVHPAASHTNSSAVHSEDDHVSMKRRRSRKSKRNAGERTGNYDDVMILPALYADGT